MGNLVASDRQQCADLQRIEQLQGDLRRMRKLNKDLKAVGDIPSRLMPISITFKMREYNTKYELTGNEESDFRSMLHTAVLADGWGDPDMKKEHLIVRFGGIELEGTTSNWISKYDLEDGAVLHAEWDWNAIERAQRSKQAKDTRNAIEREEYEAALRRIAELEAEFQRIEEMKADARHIRELEAEVDRQRIAEVEAEGRW